jgi:hypothetical protein
MPAILSQGSVQHRARGVAKAQFHRHQRVWVDSVGAWATVERLIPLWSKGFDEPVKITYDVGLGREFAGHELRAEQAVEAGGGDSHWRLLRARNKWQAPEDCAHHPHPGSFPIVVTDPADWGGWRVPGAEYDRDPHKIERQARLVASAPRLQAVAAALSEFVMDAPEDAPPELQALAKRAQALLRFISDEPAAPSLAEPERAAA